MFWLFFFWSGGDAQFQGSARSEMHLKIDWLDLCWLGWHFHQRWSQKASITPSSHKCVSPPGPTFDFQPKAKIFLLSRL